MILLLSIIILICAIIIGVDAWLAFYQWQSRISIGKWSDRLQWRMAVEKKARRWLHRAPTVKVSDNNRLVLYDILRGCYRNRTIQNWQDAGLLLGLNEEDAKRYSLLKIDRVSNDWRQKPEHPDTALLAYALKKNGTLPQQAEKTVIDLLQKLKGGNNTIPYRSSRADVRFVDTIGMVAPFLTICGHQKLAKQQIEEYDAARLPGSSIPSHAYNLTDKVPMGIYDWSRGIGWYILGLTESNADGSHNDRIVALAEELSTWQRPGGGFGCMFFNNESRCESSGSALIGLLMVRAYSINRNKKYIDAAFAVEKYLMSSTRRTGELDYCQGDTKGIGFYSHIFSIMPFAQGIALRLSKELDKYADG